MEGTGNNKRSRDGSYESPEAKRIREDLLLDILDDDVESGDRDPETQDLASVMRILEEEIAFPASDTEQDPTAAVADQEDSRQPDLGYLLEASDDELGLPPTLPSLEEGAAAEVAGADVEPSGFGKIWGIDEEIPGCYDALDFGYRAEEREAGGEDGAVFEGGLFDYPDALCGPSDFADLTWRPESLPAV